VLDNFEQVLDAGPIIADLLRAAPGLKALATSRAALHVSGEHEYPVPGLPTPPDLAGLTALERANLPEAERTVTAASLSAYEAVGLFIARATAVKPSFEVTNDNAPAVAAICARLHGMPLAIELAAARVKLFSPEALLARLEHQLNTLAAGSRDLPERQQTLRGAIAWSYDILDEPSRLILDRLSVFAGNIELDAAQAVCGPASELGIDVVDGLLSLADQSLLRTIEDPAEPRFAMLETIREFSTEMLESRGQRVGLEQRHGAWCLAFAKRGAAELSGTEQRIWLERFEDNHDNIRVAMDRAAARHDAEVALGLAYHTWRFWQKRGHLSEARRRLDALAAEPWTHEVPVLRARLMEALGGVCWWQGDIEGMGPAYREAVEIWRGTTDRSELANALYNYSFTFTVPEVVGAAFFGNEDPQATLNRLLAEARAIYRELGDDRGEANVLWGILNSRYFSNEFDPEAKDLALLALEKFRKVGDRTMEAWTLHMVGGAYVRLGQLEDARRDLTTALRIFSDASDAAGITLILDDLSSLELAEGHAEASRAAVGRGAGSGKDDWGAARVHGRRGRRVRRATACSQGIHARRAGPPVRRGRGHDVR
jgi:predicted ATPase